MSMTILLMVQVLMAVALIALILIQRGRGADTGAAFGSGASTTVFGARGSASFLTRTTAILAILFFANCFVLSFISGKTVKKATSVMDSVTTLEAARGTAEKADSAEQPPSGSETGTAAKREGAGADAASSEVPEVGNSGAGELPDAAAAEAPPESAELPPAPKN
ncbi:MAG: preprotein translocase subunit SecG [Chromatiales bacterium]